MKNQRIVHVTSVHPVFDVRIYVKECRSLVDAGFDVYLVAPHDRDEVRDGVKILAIPPVRHRLQRMTTGAARAFLRASRVEADLYHLHDPELLPWGVLLRSTRNAAVVYDSHEYLGADVATKSWINPTIAKPLGRAVTAVETLAIRRFSGVVAVNPHMAELFQPFNPNVAVVANYPPREMAQDGEHTSPMPFSALYMGPLDRDRGLRTMIDAMSSVRAAHPQAYCHVFGEIDLDKDFPELRKNEIAGAGVEVRPRVRHADIKRVMRSYSVGWLPWTAAPAYIHGTPTKLLEYMALGLPVVASNLPFVKQIVEQADCGLVVASSDPRAHADALLQLWSNPEESRRLGDNGRKAVLERLNWEAQVPALLSLYARALRTGEHA